ncbi:UNVERIFIED_CONTAM: hypothetical protein PYX00_011749 [Menopon gallinae]|uniref:Uncharacterized protein n=1 Tax=Menopon gallinae TaxID=328185 RepID=A0AAW2H8L2_9NEOP
MQYGSGKVDGNFFRLICTEYLRRKVEDGSSPADIRNIGARIGARLADDFFLRTDARRAKSTGELEPYLRQFFKLYFSYEPSVEGNKMCFDDTFILGDSTSMLMIAGVIECIFAYIVKGGIRVHITGDRQYEIFTEAGDGPGAESNVSFCSADTRPWCPTSKNSKRTLGMNKESLKRLIECERNAKTLIEEAKRGCDMMKSKARADAKEIIDNQKREYEQMLAEEKRRVQEEVQSEMRKLEEETQRRIEEIRTNTPDLKELAEHIVRKVAFCTSKETRPSLFNAYKAKKTHSRLRKHYTYYFVVMGLLLSIDTQLAFITRYIPFYQFIKLVTVVWLSIPVCSGSMFIYKFYLTVIFKKNERKVDEWLEVIRQESCQLVVMYYNMAYNKFKKEDIFACSAKKGGNAGDASCFPNTGSDAALSGDTKDNSHLLRAGGFCLEKDACENMMNSEYKSSEVDNDLDPSDHLER